MMIIFFPGRVLKKRQEEEEEERKQRVDTAPARAGEPAPERLAVLSPPSSRREKLYFIYKL